MIEVMISSTTDDLREEKTEVGAILEKLPIIKAVGSEPIASASVGRSSFIHSKELAEQCALYILILGANYGYETNDGRSATEVEFDAAYSSDPTKILVFEKVTNMPVELKQQKFIDKVTDYYSGYWRRTFTNTSELCLLVMDSFESWLEERAGIKVKLNCFDQFIRYAIQRSPFPGAQILYSLSEDVIELKYNFMGKYHPVHFSKDQIFKDYWGSMAQLEKLFLKWRGR